VDAELPHPLTGQLFSSPVPPGTGWPDDPARSDTRVARSAADVRTLSGTDDLAELDARVSVCAACPRLVDWRQEVAAQKRASFADQPYWGRPIAGWGSPTPSVLVIGLAPAANGGNRTGRIFTGDSSGDWLFASLHRVGLARQETSVHSGDGQALRGTRMVASVRCAPPANKPTPEERDTCAPWIARELELVGPSVRAVVCLGAFGWTAALRALADGGYAVPRPRPKFGHGVELPLSSGSHDLTVLGCYHPSQHNTFTGRLTPGMLDAVFSRARELAGVSREDHSRFTASPHPE
jgi:uracil-DNA glycosylase family 4